MLLPAVRTVLPAAGGMDMGRCTGEGGGNAADGCTSGLLPDERRRPPAAAAAAAAAEAEEAG